MAGEPSTSDQFHSRNDITPALQLYVLNYVLIMRVNLILVLLDLSATFQTTDDEY